MQFEGVAIERGEERRIGKIEIGLIERDLRRVDRLSHTTPLFTTSFQGAAPSALVSHSADMPSRGAGDETAIDVTFKPAVERRSQTAGRRSVRYADRSLRRATRPRRYPRNDGRPRRSECLPSKSRPRLWDGQIVVLDLPQAFAAKARGTHIMPWRLRAIANAKRTVDRLVDGDADARWPAGLSYWQPEP